MSNLFERRYFLFDFARGRHLNKTETILLFETLKRAGYNGIALHLEGFFETKKYKGIVKEAFLTLEEAKWFCARAKEYDFDIIPVINLVAHAESFIFHQERFADMRRTEYTTRTDRISQFNLFDKRLEPFAYSIIDEIINIFSPNFLHIGGDETTLNDDEKEKYVVFLSNLCSYIRKKGIKPCIWGDMILENQSMLKDFTKDVTVFDWYYNGHRKESLEKIQKNGFNEIFACCSDQGWDCFIGTQRHFGKNVAFDEKNLSAINQVEAFLCDANELGIKNAMVTNWENYNGHNLWSQMDAIVRAGLYMTGRDFSNESVEKCLFGRITPHFKITRLLQKLQLGLYSILNANKSHKYLNNRMTNGIFIEYVFMEWVGLTDEIIEQTEDFYPLLNEANQLFDGWIAENEVEKICRASINATLCYVKSMFSLMRLCGHGYRKYHEAAVKQFDNQKESIQCLNSVIEYISKLISDVNEFKEAQSKYLSMAGQTKLDLIRLEAFANSMGSFSNKIMELSNHIDEYKDDIDNMYVLPGWHFLMLNVDKFESVYK